MPKPLAERHADDWLTLAETSRAKTVEEMVGMGYFPEELGIPDPITGAASLVSDD